jgi:hypothetical protein
MGSHEIRENLLKIKNVEKHSKYSVNMKHFCLIRLKRHDNQLEEVLDFDFLKWISAPLIVYNTSQAVRYQGQNIYKNMLLIE